MEDNFKIFNSTSNNECVTSFELTNTYAPIWAYHLLAEATQQTKKAGLQIIKYVRDLFCNSEIFDWGLWFLSCSVMENLVAESFQNEFSIHSLFKKEYPKICAGEIIERKNNPKHKPDVWVKRGEDFIPVEIKLKNFDKKAMDQLLRYMQFYNCDHGIAVGEELTVSLSSNIEFISIAELKKSANSDAKNS